MSEVGKIITIVSGQFLPVQNFTAAGRTPNLTMNEDHGYGSVLRSLET